MAEASYITKIANQIDPELVHHELEIFLADLVHALKPKARAALKAEILDRCERYETYQGRRFPPNVTPLRGRYSDESDRRNRSERAAAMRYWLGLADL